MIDKPPFLESEFATAMQGLEFELLNQPGWKELLQYRGISGFDAGYMSIYWKFLEIMRQQTDPNWSVQLSDQRSTGRNPTRIKRVIERIKDGEITTSEALRISVERLRNMVIMRLPPKDLPQFSSPHKALVVRSYRNTSPFPILKQLSEEDGWQVLFASWNPRLEQPVREIGIPFLFLRDSYRRYYTQGMRTHSRMVQNLIGQVDTSLPVRLLSARLGVITQYDARELLINNLVRVRLFTDIYIDLLTTLHPDVVILFNETSLPERLMALVARISGTTSIAIQHGLYIGYVYRSLAADKMIVWGEIPRQFWLDKGCKPNQVINVGAFSHVNWSSGHVIKKPVRKSNKRRILVLGQNPDAYISQLTHRRTIAAIFRAAQALPEYDFVIRPHPGESVTPYENVYEIVLQKSNIEICNEGTVESALKECDLAITVFSTAGVEAMLLDKPVIVFDLSNEPPLAPYANSAKLIRKPDTLPIAIREILENTTIRQKLVASGKKYTGKYLGSRDGESINRAVEVIKGLRTNSKTQ